MQFNLQGVLIQQINLQFLQTQNRFTNCTCTCIALAANLFEMSQEMVQYETFNRYIINYLA